MKILLRGYYGFGNFGDDLLLSACYSLVKQRFPRSEISIFANFSEGLKSFQAPNGYRNYVKYLLDDNIELIDWRDRRNFDLEIFGGGEVFKSGQSNRVALISNLLGLLLGASTTSKSVAGIRALLGRELRIKSSSALAIGVGVDRHRIMGENLIRNMEQLGRLAHIYVRDKESALNVRRMRLECKLGSDLAFLLKDQVGTKRVEQSKRKGLGAVLCAGKPGTSQVLAALRIRRQFEPVTLVFFDENYDKELIIKARSDGFNVLVWQPQKMSIGEFLERLAQFSIIISSRFHGALCSAMLGIPSLVMETDVKLKSVLGILPNCGLGFVPSDSIENFEIYLRELRSENFSAPTKIDLDLSFQFDLARKMVTSAFGSQR